MLNYAADNAINPAATRAHIIEFTKLAHSQNPGLGLAQKLPLYRNVAGSLVGKIDTLDQDRRRLAHQDLNQNMLTHVAKALKTGQSKPALAAIGAHMRKLAQQHGVSIPGEAGSSNPVTAAAPAAPADASTMMAGGPGAMPSPSGPMPGQMG